MERFGTVQNIPLNYDNNFVENATSDVAIKPAIKLRRRNSVKKNAFILIFTSVKIGFTEKSFPKSIKFNFCVLPVDYLISTAKQ